MSGGWAPASSELSEGDSRDSGGPGPRAVLRAGGTTKGGAQKCSVTPLVSHSGTWDPRKGALSVVTRGDGKAEA